MNDDYGNCVGGDDDCGDYLYGDGDGNDDNGDLGNDVDVDGDDDSGQGCCARESSFVITNIPRMVSLYICPGDSDPTDIHWGKRGWVLETMLLFGTVGGAIKTWLFVFFT